LNSLSTLTWVLMIMAVVVVGGVLLFNFIQEKKLSSKVPKVSNFPNAPHGSKGAAHNPASSTVTESDIHTLSDVIPSASGAASESHFVGNRIEQTSSTEPTLGVLTQYLGDGAAKASGDSTEWASAAEAAAQALQVDKGPNTVTNASTIADPKAEVAPSLPASVLSDDFDYLLEFALPSLQSGERLLALTAAHRRAGGKPVAFDGLLASGQWVILQPGELYIALRAGLLLANRHGPLNAMEFSDFGNFAQELAKQLDCEISLADMPRVLSRARDVDRRCAELDAQLGINIQTSSVISPAMLSRVSVEQGLTEKGSGRFAKLDDKGGTLFTLSFGEQGDKLAMLLDVPRAPANHRPWQQMLQCAELLAQRLDGQLVDDTGKPLPSEVWGQIEEQLRQRYWALDAAGIEPGSARALRLFN
jgi:hypothetical protein